MSAKLLLGVEQLAQRLSTERYIAGQHDPFDDFDGIACAGNDLGAATVAHVVVAFATPGALISRRAMAVTSEGSAAAMKDSTYDRTPGGAP
jgi:hypothetical protein